MMSCHKFKKELNDMRMRAPNALNVKWTISAVESNLHTEEPAQQEPQRHEQPLQQEQEPPPSPVETSNSVHLPTTAKCSNYLTLTERFMPTTGTGLSGFVSGPHRTFIGERAGRRRRLRGHC